MFDKLNHERDRDNLKFALDAIMLLDLAIENGDITPAGKGGMDISDEFSKGILEFYR